MQITTRHTQRIYSVTLYILWHTLLLYKIRQEITLFHFAVITFHGRVITFCENGITFRVA